MYLVQFGTSCLLSEISTPKRLSCVTEYPRPVLEATTTSSTSLALTLCQLRPQRLQRSHSLLANLAPPWLCAGEVSPSELHETRILTQLGSISLNPQSCTGSVRLRVPRNRNSPHCYAPVHLQLSI